MKLELSTGWDVDVERGPDWLFIRLHAPEAGLYECEADLAGRLWEILHQSFCRRVVVELDQLAILPSYLIGQLLMLQKRVGTTGGIMRICGLTPNCEQTLRINRLSDRLFPYRDRTEAVMGLKVTKPR